MQARSRAAPSKVTGSRVDAVLVKLFEKRDKASATLLEIPCFYSMRNW